ncbi:hypothetical protein CYLTODRAFT_415145 [Cylindrobasidium torrendii FP15055 ss-10]|uniref:Uncharacterized protein n=1 Tax=Cylindrobasidium torrendii FP15055 ss-10 TaxID=1314674 RepID=A0A0D7AX52_9AGAR|nr:hypothetical protein CYLTODRAFT_415145 [Cylindrobasidium torrendii FP15055 ss-10]
MCMERRAAEERLNSLAGAWGAILAQAKVNASYTYRGSNSQKWAVPTLIGQWIDARHKPDATTRSLEAARHEGDCALSLGEDLLLANNALRSVVDAVDFASNASLKKTSNVMVLLWLVFAACLVKWMA